jgi:pyridoxine kinase
MRGGLGLLFLFCVDISGKIPCMQVLSIQSHVAYGYVGNRVAVFLLERLGIDVVAVNTVQFSNHTAYPDFTGDVMSPKHIQNILYGVEARGVFPRLDALLTGYLGDMQIASLILETCQKIKKENPEMIYCCDPVIGDVGKGVFVREGLGEFFKQHLVPLADILTPNVFEASHLTGMPIETLADALAACRVLRKLGPQTIVLTSFHCPKEARTIEMLLHTDEGTWLISTPYFNLDYTVNGAGDATAALFLGYYLLSRQYVSALEKTAAVIHSLFEATYAKQSRELQIHFEPPGLSFTVERVRD